MSHLIPENFDFSPSGQCDPLFLFADNVQKREIPARVPLSEAQRRRLVKRPESPTRDNSLENAYSRHKFEFDLEKLKNCEPSPKCAVMVEHDIPPQKTDQGAVGCRTIVEHRKYSEVEQMWRVRTQVDAGMDMRPPENSGARVSEMLSLNGARKIAESSEYVAAAYGGYTTFCTATVNAETRKIMRSYNAGPAPLDQLYSYDINPLNCRHNDFTKRKYSSICFYGDHGAPFTPIELTPQTTMQRETSRTMDAINKVYQRGCLLDIAEPSKTDNIISVESAGFSIPEGFDIQLTKWRKVKTEGPCSAVNYRVRMPPKAKVVEVVRGKYSALAGFKLDKDLFADGPCSPVRFKRETLRYCWVFEVPKNSLGEDNPHIHFMMDWKVDYRFFVAWAARLEGLWSGGYFHIEKIKDPLCAGAYMAKACGYLIKAAGDEGQGVVTGNRYGISASARAPAWVTISEAQLDVMGQIINDVYDHLQVKYRDDIIERRRLNEALKEAPKNHRKLREKIAGKLQRVRKKLKAVPVIASKYHVVVKGKEAAMQFFTWLKTPTDPNVMVPSWLPEKPEGVVWNEGKRAGPADSVYITAQRNKFNRLKFWRRLRPPEWFSEVFENNEFWHQVKADYDVEIMGEPVPAYLDL